MKIGNLHKRKEHQARSSEGENVASKLKAGESASIRSVDFPGNPILYPRQEHSLSRKDVETNALKVMYRLVHHGYLAFLVGGAVRDLLLGKIPKDFDVSTDARPDELRALFRNSRVIGRRFRLVHVFFRGNQIIEVSTLRSKQPDGEDGEVATLAMDNTFGNPQTDAFRRDLTINGLFYDLRNFSIVDYVGGVEDLRQGIIRVIGEPTVRIQEDPVRMIRAVRHAARAGFSIEPVTLEAICENSGLIAKAPKARIHEELIRELRYGFTENSFALFERTGLLTYLLPELASGLKSGDDRNREWLFATLANIDKTARDGVELSPAVLFLALFIAGCSSDVLAESSEDGYRDIATLIWDKSPFGSSEGDSVLIKRSVSECIQVARAGIVRSAVDTLFRSLGVSKRERENMEFLLVARLQMFGAFNGQGNYSSLVQRSYFKNALELLRVTACDDISQRCLEFWEAKQHTKSVSRKRSEPGDTRERGLKSSQKSRRRRNYKPKPKIKKEE